MEVLRWSYGVTFFVGLFFIGLSDNVPCVPRMFDDGGMVCVCNATTCDTIPPLPACPPRCYTIVTSTKDGLRFEVTRKNFGAKLKTRGLTLTVNSNITYQTMRGFGGAFTDAAGMNIKSLSEPAQDKLMESYFSSDGLEYNIGRVPIAGCDFSVRPYTYADYPNDVTLSKFNLTQEDYEWKIPYIKKAIALRNGSLHLMAAAWSAPPWMKTNNDYIGFGFLKEEFYQAWAQYHIKFLDKYAEHGLKFWLLSTGNEPLNGAIPMFHFNCLGWTPSTQKTWLKDNLGPLLRGSDHKDTGILALDDQRFMLPWWVLSILGDKESSQYVSAVGTHWYWDHVVPIGLLDKTRDMFPDKFIISTEACFVPKLWDSSVVTLGSWTRGEQYAENIIDTINHWVSGWVDWNLALDPAGGPNWAKNFVDAAIIVNSTADEFYKQPMFYAVGHFSKFVPEGSVRIDIQGGDKTVKTTAFRTPDDMVVIIILNKKTTDVPISINGAPRGYANFIAWRKSITTILYKDKKPPIYRL